MSSSNGTPSPGVPSISSHQSDHLNLRVTYLHAGNPRPPHNFGAVPASTTIGELKSRLQTELLEHPRPEEQRLIYQGRPLMQNDVTLKEALRLEGPIGPLPYTIHIIIQPRQASSHFRPTQSTPISQPTQNSNGPQITQNSPPNPQVDPQAALEQAQRVQAMAHAQLNLLQQQLATWNPMLGQNPGQMPQNFSATFQIHGQPANMLQAGPPNFRPAQTNVPNLQAMMAEQQRLRAQAPMHNHPPIPNTTSQVNNHASPPSLTDHLTAHASSGLSPFQRPSSAPGHPRSRQTGTPSTRHTPTASVDRPPAPLGLGSAPMFSPLQHPFSHTIPSANHSSQPTVWLASSRNGPEALLFAPGHGFFSSYTPTSQPTPAPTRTVPNAGPTTEPHSQPPPQPPAGAAPGAGQGQVAIRQPDGQAQPQPPARNQNQDENDFWGLVVQRGWLFLRLYMFMFVLSEPGTWRRYGLLILAMIVCLLPRENFLNNAFGVARRHIDNLIGPPQPQPRDRETERARRQREQQGVAGGRQQSNRPQDQGAQGTANIAQTQPAGPSGSSRLPVRGAVNTTPEETARRLVRENEQRNPNILRDMFYRLEQAVALFLASLVPGIGERHVAAREEARREEERERLEAQRAREEEEKRREAEQEQAQTEKARDPQEPNLEGSESSKTAPAPTDTSTSAAGEGSGSRSRVVETGSSSSVEPRIESEGESADVRARFT